MLQNVEIYIGNNSDYTKNAKCPGGPFMVVNDLAKSYTSGTYSGWSRSGDMWNYGFEAWCNLEGQYVTIVADLANLKSLPSYEMTIC